MPKVAILMGSPNDRTKMQPAVDTLAEFGVDADVRVLSAHRTPHQVVELVSGARDAGYAAFICGSEAQHPLISWDLADWDDRPPLRILQYRGKRLTAADQKHTYKELFSVTLEQKEGHWVVTKYDSMY